MGNQNKDKKYFELTKEFIQRKNNHTKKHWFSKTGIITAYTFWSQRKRNEGADNLLLQDIKFSQESKDWLEKKISENEFGKQCLQDWKQHLKSHRFKRSDRLHFLVIYAAVFASIIVLTKSGYLPDISILLAVLCSYPVLDERQQNTNIISALDELEELIQLLIDQMDS